jgi:hypothetical protein
MKELRSAETYISALEQIEKLYKDKLLCKASSLPDNRREELENFDIATYTDEIHRERGYDDGTKPLLNNLCKKYKSRYSKTQNKYKKKNLKVAVRYVNSLRRKTEMITDGDKILLNIMSKYPIIFESAYFALDEINKITPAGDRIMQVKADYMRNNADNMRKNEDKIQKNADNIRKNEKALNKIAKNETPNNMILVIAIIYALLVLIFGFRSH